jgi:hypothetical protein
MFYAFSRGFYGFYAEVGGPHISSANRKSADYFLDLRVFTQMGHFADFRFVVLIFVICGLKCFKVRKYIFTVLAYKAPI